MKTVYIRTINHFKRELKETAWWRFIRISFLQAQIDHYEYLLENYDRMMELKVNNTTVSVCPLCEKGIRDCQCTDQDYFDENLK